MPAVLELPSGTHDRGEVGQIRSVWFVHRLHRLSVCLLFWIRDHVSLRSRTPMLL